MDRPLEQDVTAQVCLFVLQVSLSHDPELWEQMYEYLERCFRLLARNRRFAWEERAALR